MQTKNSDEVFTYLGVKDCGCAVAVAVIKPQYAKETREFINECLDDGLYIERVSLETSRERLTSCPHSKNNPEAKTPEAFSRKYICTDCDKRHDNESQAANCCPPEVEEVFVCNGCEKEFDYEDEAREHAETDCDHVGEDFQKVLEAAGQQRMFER